MDCVYSINLNAYSNENDTINRNQNQICSLSCKFLLAYSIESYVYVIPLEKPNEFIQLKSNISEINGNCTQLCWSEDGLHLFSVHKSGTCNLYQLKKAVLNQIEVVHTLELPNEEIVAIKWLNKTPKLYFDWSKRDSTNYFDRYYQYTFSTVQTFGNYANNGVLILTKTGKLNVLLIDFNSIKNKYERLEFNLQQYIPDRFDLTDILCDHGGNIVLICSRYDANSPVNIYNIRLHVTAEGTLTGTCEHKSTININTDEQSLLKYDLNFCHTEHRNSICVFLNSKQTNTSQIQFWNYNSESTSESANGEGYEQIMDQNESPGWHHMNTQNYSSLIKSISIPKFPITYNDMLNGYLNGFYIVVGFENGSVTYIDRLNYAYTTTTMLNESLNTQVHQSQPASEYNIKRKRVEPYFRLLEQSQSGLICAGITNTNCLVVFRQLNSTIVKDPSVLVSLYEYAMLSGNDYWDLLINTKQRVSDGLIERLDERFKQQSLPIQRTFLTKFYSLMYSLYRQSTYASSFKSIDFLIKIILSRCVRVIQNSVQSLNDNQLPVMSIQDIVIEALKQLKPNEAPKLNDIIQTLFSRKTLQISVTQQLKHILQWTLDVALYTIQQITNSSGNQTANSAKLQNDLNFVNDLRKCFVYLKLLFTYAEQQQQQHQQSQQNNFVFASLPILPLRSTTTKDLLGDLYGVYTKLALRLSDLSTLTNVDDVLIDQCLNIQAETLTRPIDELLLQLKYPWINTMTRTSCLHLSVDKFFPEEKLINKKDYPLFDVIRLINFSRSENMKQCIRCGNFTESSTHTKDDQSNCVRLFDLGSDRCVCNGLWVLTYTS